MKVRLWMIIALFLVFSYTTYEGFSLLTEPPKIDLSHDDLNRSLNNVDTTLGIQHNSERYSNIQTNIYSFYKGMQVIPTHDYSNHYRNI